MSFRKDIKGLKQVMKDSGIEKGKDFDYETVDDDRIVIDCKGNEKLRDRILKSMDSSIEWGLRMTR